MFPKLGSSVATAAAARAAPAPPRPGWTSRSPSVRTVGRKSPSERDHGDQHRFERPEESRGEQERKERDGDLQIGADLNDLALGDEPHEAKRDDEPVVTPRSSFPRRRGRRHSNRADSQEGGVSNATRRSRAEDPRSPSEAPLYLPRKGDNIAGAVSSPQGRIHEAPSSRSAGVMHVGSGSRRRYSRLVAGRSRSLRFSTAPGITLLRDLSTGCGDEGTELL